MGMEPAAVSDIHGARALAMLHRRGFRTEVGTPDLPFPADYSEALRQELLERLGMPTFYDKLLPVPLLNVAIQGIDQAARSNLLKRFDPPNAPSFCCWSSCARRRTCRPVPGRARSSN